MLILFDIDATLIKTSGAGIRAMVAAGRGLFGPGFTADGLDFAGRLDPLILDEMLRLSGVGVTPDNLRAIRAAYGRELARVLGESPAIGRRLPGVSELLDALAERDGVTLGLLTGNFAETGRLKLSACGVDPDRFRVAAWGDESPHSPPARDHLPPVAMRRYRERFGRVIEPDRVTIVGDTPHDVRCALVHGCRALGVGTGRFTPEVLRGTGAHHALPDLSRTDEVLAWLFADPASTGAPHGPPPAAGVR